MSRDVLNKLPKGKYVISKLWKNAGITIAKKNVSVLSCQDNRMCDTKLAIRSGVVVG